jgi:hypothetical protein
LQAPFRLSWGCNEDKNGQHKHDFVSFEKGDITTAERSNKQVALSAKLDSLLTEYLICFQVSEMIVEIISLLLACYIFFTSTNTVLTDFAKMGIASTNSSFCD